MAIGGDQHHQRPVGGQADELDMFDRRLVLWRQHQRGAMGGQAEGRSDPVQQGASVAAIAHRGVDLLALGHVQVADLKQAIDEHPQPLLRRDAPGADMGAAQQAQILQILHHVADGRRRDLLAHHPGQAARAHGLAGVQIAFDHAAEHLARAVVQVFQGRMFVGHSRLVCPDRH